MGQAETRRANNGESRRVLLTLSHNPTSKMDVELGVDPLTRQVSRNQCCVGEGLQVKCLGGWARCRLGVIDVDGERRKLARASWICSRVTSVPTQVLGPTWAQAT